MHVLCSLHYAGFYIADPCVLYHIRFNNLLLFIRTFVFTVNKSLLSFKFIMKGQDNINEFHTVILIFYVYTF